MKIVVSGGGTAGHINPALACAAVLVSMGHEVCYVGTPNGMEARLAPAAGYEYIPLEAAGYDRAHMKTLFSSSAKILRSSRIIAKRFREMRPDAIVGFGGYVSLPVGMGARRCGIPVIAHEQNSVPGMTNRYLAKHGAVMALTFEMTKKYLECPPERMFVVGNPVRDSILSADRSRGRQMFGIPDGATFLLIFGGSLGAQHVNRALIADKDMLLSRPDLYVVHSTGAANYTEVHEAIGDEPRWQVRDYIDEMGDALAGCDAVISRAGSTSLMEIAACGAPALLIPFPYATDDHQTKNAADWAACGACVMASDHDLDSDAFKTTLCDFLDDEPARRAMGEKVRTFAKPDAAHKLAELVVDTALSARG